MQRDSGQANDTESKVQRLDKVYSFPDEDFDQKYAPDDFGDEASDHARVWKVYRDEAKPRDEKKIEGWNRTFDVLLTFAGLYSAALTAFLVESYQTLKQDSTDYTADILFRIASLNPSANISQSDRALDAIRPPDKGYTPSTPMLWVNGLWFTSLALTLAVAFLCILAKQWLYEHERMLSDRTITARRWTQEHVLQSRALETWHITGLVSGLPTVLHTALFLFMAGLFVFLREFNKTVAGLIVVIGGPVLLFFIIQLFTPILALSCSWRSPFGRAIEDITLVITVQILLVMGPVRRAAVARVSSLFAPARSLLPCFRSSSATRLSTAPGAPVSPASSTPAEGPEPSRAATDDSSCVSRSGWSHRARLDAMLAQKASYLEAVALRRLLRSPTRSVVATAIQAIGSIRPTSPTIAALTRLPHSEGDSADAADARVRGYIVSRSKDMTSEQRARNPRVTYEAVHCIKAWASITKLDEQLVKDKSIIHNPYHNDSTLPLDVQVISALMSDFTPASPGDTNFELSDIAIVFRNTPCEPQRFRLRPSSLRLLSDIVGAGIDKHAEPDINETTQPLPTLHEDRDRDATERVIVGDDIDRRDDGPGIAPREISNDETAKLKISKRLISELAVLHGLLSICLFSWLTGDDWREFNMNDFIELSPRIARLLKHVRKTDGSFSTRPQEFQHAVLWFADDDDKQPELPNDYDIVPMWFAFSRFWLEAQYFDDDDGLRKVYTAGPHPRNIAALLLLCGRNILEASIRNRLRQDALFWNTLIVLLDIYVSPGTDKMIDVDRQGRTLAALIRMAGDSLDPQQPPPASLACFRDYSAKTFFAIDADDVVLSAFLAEEEGSCAWRVLHEKVCSDGAANANVLSIAKVLAGKLQPKEEEEEEDEPNPYTDIFFSGNALEHCIAGAYEAWLYLIGEALLSVDRRDVKPDFRQALLIMSVNSRDVQRDLEDFVTQLKKADQKKHLQMLREFMMWRTFREKIAEAALRLGPHYDTIVDVIYTCAHVSRQRTARALSDIIGDELPHPDPEPLVPTRRHVPHFFLDFVASSVHARLKGLSKVTESGTSKEDGRNTREFIKFLRSNSPFEFIGAPAVEGPSRSSYPAF